MIGPGNEASCCHGFQLLSAALLVNMASSPDPQPLVVRADSLA